MGMEHGGELYEACDCCGRDAEDCGMSSALWVRDRSVLPDGGTFCRTCAHLLRIVRLAERCAWCQAPLVEEVRAESDGWGYFADTLGVLHPCCPACLAERFGITGRIRVRRKL